MSAAKHTPGPWHVKDGGDNIIVSADGEFVCADGTGEFIAIPNDDDARLIAAAPELLEALQRCLDSGFITGVDWLEDMISAAIAKAIGQGGGEA